MIENKRKLAVYYWNKTEADGADLGTEIFGVNEKDRAIKMFVRIATNNMG